MLEPDRDLIGKSDPARNYGSFRPTTGLGALERLGGRRQRGRVLLCMVVSSVRQDSRGDGRSGGAPTTGQDIPSRIGLAGRRGLWMVSAELSKLAERAFLERRPIVSPHPSADGPLPLWSAIRSRRRSGLGDGS